MSNAPVSAASSRRAAIRSASTSGSLIIRVMPSYSAAVASGSRPPRSVAITGAPGQTCSIGSHLLLATRNFMATAWRQISDSSAVFPIPDGPETSTTLLDPCWRAPRSAASASAIGSLRPRNGPDRNGPPCVSDTPG